MCEQAQELRKQIEELKAALQYILDWSDDALARNHAREALAAVLALEG